MTIAYTGDGGLFTDLGSVIKAVNEVDPMLEGLDYDYSLIETSLSYGNQSDALDPALGIVSGAKSSLVGLRSSYSQICELRLQDYLTVVQILNLPSDDIYSILKALITKMNADTASVNASAVTLGSVTAGSGNVGNGTVLVSATLDGYSSPTAFAQPHPAYIGLLSQLSVSETETITVTADSYANSATAGEETLSISGWVPLDSAWSQGVEGSGDGPSLQTLQAGTILSNMDMETFSVTNTPDSWTILTGTVTTNIARESSVVYRGTYALKFIGTGAAASISVGQSIAASRLTPLRRYCCAFRYRASAAEGLAGKTFTVQMTGTGYTAGSTEKVTMDGTALPTSYTLGYFFVNMPSVIPSDMKMVISFTGTPTVTLYIDDFGFAPVEWHNGIGFAAVAGSTNFVNGDTFTLEVTNDQAGTFQEYFRRQWGVQLPSNTSGAETISDALAE